MSCIIALKTPNSIILGADKCAGIHENLQVTIDNRKIFPMVRTAGWIGTSGDCSSINILEGVFEEPEYLNDEDPYIYLIRDYVPELKDCFEKNKINPSDGMYGIDIIIVMKNKFYHICSDLSVMDANLEYLSVGSGSEYAMGSLYSTQGMDPEERILIALKSAEEFCPGVKGPFDIEIIPGT